MTIAVAEDSEEQLIQVRKEIVDLHEEIVLFLNFCAINHTGMLYLFAIHPLLVDYVISNVLDSLPSFLASSTKQ